MTMLKDSCPGPIPGELDARTPPAESGTAFESAESRDNNSGFKGFKLPSSALLEVLEGVVGATDMSKQDAAVVAEFMSSIRLPAIHGGDSNIPPVLSFIDWTGAIGFSLWDVETEDDVRQVANLVLGIAFLREASRATGGIVTKDDLDLAWELIESVLTHKVLTRPLFSISRNAQGSLGVPLYSLKKDGNVDELFRLDVWLPNEQEQISNIAIHAHHSSSWSWALAGEGIDHRYAVKPVTDPVLATHTEHVQSWTDAKNVVTSQTIHQTSPVISNTRKLVCATSTDSVVHTRDMSLSTPAGTYHRTEVSADILRATLSSFDSRLGFVKDSCLLRPRDGEPFTESHSVASMRPAALATMVRIVRNWEDSMEGGKQNAERGALSQALLSFNSALFLSRSGHMPNAPYYEHLALTNIERTNRRLGRE